MDGWGRRIFWLLIIGGGAYYLYSHRASAPSSSSSPAAGDATTFSGDCVMKAEAANRALHDAAMLLSHMPVDASAWSDAESGVSSKISDAESSCSGGASEAERSSQAEVKEALSLMRRSLSGFSAASRGGGGASDAAQLQEQIDQHLDRARAAVGARGLGMR